MERHLDKATLLGLVEELFTVKDELREDGVEVAGSSNEVAMKVEAIAIARSYEKDLESTKQYSCEVNKNGRRESEDGGYVLRVHRRTKS
ncbi:hypothetical protein CMI41_04350 [Candidatus Pacearchaeota archaeon]|nr:hypothetical protein [Candidatus Pacearchaeota archaeon]|tara:strand:- start:4037 stop:4303 length:267 start_codon:yes stop_codon:yes gene_type:complete